MEPLAALAGWLRETTRAVVLTGAGISTESGIPDFRSPGGIWTRYDPRQFTFDRYVAEPEVRKLAWQVRRERIIDRAEPNGGHIAIARLEELGRVRGVVTQNVDGLHQRAGSRNVIELHGSSARTACLTCGASWPTEEVIRRVEAGDEDPHCTLCGGVIKTTTISFGQAMPWDLVDEARDWAQEAEVFLVVGSSLVVYPAAALPAEAAKHGARLAIVNREPTPFDNVADVVVNADAGPTLSRVVELCES